MKKLVAVIALVAIMAVGTVVLAQTPPPCRAQCYVSYGQCKSICTRPNVLCFVPCEFILQLCLDNCA